MGYLNYILLKNKAYWLECENLKMAQGSNFRGPDNRTSRMGPLVFCILFFKLHCIRHIHRSLEPYCGERFNDLHRFLYFLLYNRRFFG